MKSFYTLLCFLLTSLLAVAQLPTLQKATPFDKFISQPPIRWAAYINDTVRFERYNLTRLLIEKFAKGQIKASLPVGFGSADAMQVKYLRKEAIDAIKFPMLADTIAGYVGDQPDAVNYTIRRRIPLDTSRSLLSDITQILYIENDQLKSYIPWISPMFPAYTSSGIYLGESDYFSTCFNFNYATRFSSNHYSIALGSSQTFIKPDSIDRKYNLKELYGQGLLAALWPQILKGRYGLVEYEKKTGIKPGDLITPLLNQSLAQVPKYDSLGYISEYVMVKDPLTAADFPGLSIHFNWFYDTRLNLVYNQISRLDLWARRTREDGTITGLAPVVSVLF